MFKLLVICLAIPCSMAMAQDFPLKGNYTCQINHLDENQRLISSYQKTVPLKFDGEDTYWYGHMEIKEFGIEAEYYHTQAGGMNPPLYSGFMKIQSKDSASGKVSISSATVPIRSPLYHQIPVPEFKIEERPVAYVNIGCFFED